MYKFQKVKYPKCNIDYDWMLVLETEEDVLRYCEQSFKADLGKAWDNIIKVSQGRAHIDNNLAMIINYSSDNYGTKTKSLFELSVRTMDRLVNDKLECIKRSGKIFVGKQGGYFPQHPDFIVYDECLIENKKVIFPSYEKKDIRVKQWEGGTHYYAYVGAFQVEWNGQKKWNTSEDAQKYAGYYLYFLNKKQYEIKE